jgi:pimeloyl-ACP methyl ester carboxylesterase
MAQNPETPPLPAWVSEALAAPAREAEVEHAGVPLRYRAWGTPGRPGLVLVHGAMAHANWWDFIAPRLAADFHVVAPHLSGMGDSGHRDAYSTAQFADDVVAVMDHAGLASDTVVIGHSLGGAVALTLGVRHAGRVRGIVMLDSAVFPPDQPSPFDPARAPYRPKTICDDAETAIGRFFLLPPQPCHHPYLLRHVAQHSVAPMQGGWSWKFDDALFRKLDMHEQWRELEALETPLAVIYGDRSAIFGAPVRDYVAGLARQRGWPMFAIADGHHHLMLDSPRALAAALHGLLAGWPGRAI